MLKKSDIRALAKKLNWDTELTRKCLESTFSDTNIIDGNIVLEEDVSDFLRLCINTDLDGLTISKFFRGNFTNLNKINETLRYFYHDTFFSYLVYFFRSSFPKIFIKDNGKYGEYSFNYMIYVESGFSDWELRRSVDCPLELIIEGFRVKELDKYKCATDVISPLIPELGFRIFKSQYVLDEILEMQDLQYYRCLDKVAKNINSYFINWRKKTKYKNYYLCDRLYMEALCGRRESFRIVAKMLNIPEKSSHRRFYDVQKELKDKGMKIDNVLSIEEIYQLDRSIERVKRYPDSYK